MVARLLGYLVPAAALTVVFAEPGELGDARRLLGRFVTYLIVGVLIAVPAELMGRLGTRWLAPAGSPPWRRIALWGAVVVISTLLGGELAARLLAPLMPGTTVASLRAAIFRVGLVVCAVIVAGNVVYEELRARARATEAAASQARQAALRAELAALQARTNPHFLFNSLNSVAALIEEEPARAEAALLSLSRVFRYALDGSRRPSVPLAEELAAVRSYLAVEVLRFGDRLRVVEAIAEGVGSHPIPTMSLQPLVENAVLHGVAGRREGGEIWVSAAREGEKLLLRVSSPLPEGAARGGAGTALADLRARIAILHGEGASLQAGPEGDEFRAELRLPWELA